jgi:hypothetical protein
MSQAYRTGTTRQVLGSCLLGGVFEDVPPGRCAYRRDRILTRWLRNGAGVFIFSSSAALEKEIGKNLFDDVFGGGSSSPCQRGCTDITVREARRHPDGRRTRQGYLVHRSARKDALLRGKQDTHLHSLRVFSESPVILRLFGARRLSQQIILPFPSPGKVPTPIYAGPRRNYSNPSISSAGQTNNGRLRVSLAERLLRGRAALEGFQSEQIAQVS